MKRIVMGAVLLAVLAGPIHAEDEENPYAKKREQIKKENEAMDKQYKRTLDATRGAASAPAKNDPWANMRGSTDASKAK